MRVMQRYVESSRVRDQISFRLLGSDFGFLKCRNADFVFGLVRPKKVGRALVGASRKPSVIKTGSVCSINPCSDLL
jgi:hypothetical protein